MPYIAPADFREATLKEYCRGLKLTSTEAPDAELTAAIAGITDRIDDYTSDHFEAETAATLQVTGRGGRALYLPKRIRTVTAVKIRDSVGTLTTQDVATYRVESSLNAAGTDIIPGARDFIYLTEGYYAAGLASWPEGPQTIQVEGNFSWAATPRDIKRATALLVYDHFKPQTENLRRAEEWTTTDARYIRSSSEPTGIPEVDQIIKRFDRRYTVGFGSIPIVRESLVESEVE